MAYKLDIVLPRNDFKFRIAWFEDGDEGGALGQDESEELAIRRKTAKHGSIGPQAARRASAGAESDSCSLFWSEYHSARTALALARTALKHERPMPEWAQTALANGWKARRGWKP